MITLKFPTKIACRDSYCVKIDSLNQAQRFLSQPFGVNWAQDPNLYINMGMKGHDGVDIPVPNGTPVYASHDGVVLYVDNNDDRDGLGVELYDPVQKIRTIYWHNQENKVTIGQSVKVGDLIGYSGATGKAYGPHVHFSLYQTDEIGKIINYDNGFHGAINPMTYLVFNEITIDMIITKELLPLLYQAVLHRLPDTDFWVGHTVEEFFKDSMSQVEWKKLDILITDARNI